MGRKRKHPMGRNYNDNDMAKNLDALREFEKFKSEILPKIQKMLKEGKKAEDIIAWGQSLAAARLVTDALTNEDSNQALKSVKEVLDRGLGKPVEKVQTTHKFEKLKEEELDALLESRLAEISVDDEATEEKH